jgi:hypothetical protein
MAGFDEAHKKEMREKQFPKRRRLHEQKHNFVLQIIELYLPDTSSVSRTCTK